MASANAPIAVREALTVGYMPDYLFLLQTILRSDPQGAVNFALMMSQKEGDCPVDYNTITDLFLQRNMIREATAFLLDVLKPNLPEHAFLQTKVLEINLVTYPNVADAILANGIEWALECMKDLLLVNLRANLQIIVQTAKEYSEQLGVDASIKLFEQFKSYEGLYFFLGSYLSSSEDPEIHFKYIEAAAKTAKLPDARPLINVYNRFGFVPDLTHFLYKNNMLRYVEGYVQKVNPGTAPLVVGQLLDDECPEDFIKGLILSVRSLLPVESLVAECEKRNHLQLLTQFLEHLARYVAERMDVDLWEKVLVPENEYRRQLIVHVVSTALPESKNPEQVSAAVKAFMTTDLPHELIELLEKIVLQNSAFSGNFNLQKLLILTAIKADSSRVMDYINRLDNFDGSAVGEVAVEAQLYKEAFAIFNKFNLNLQAVNVLLDNIQSIERDVEFAFRVEEDSVWSQVGKVQLREGLVSEAIESFIRADDAATQFLDVIRAAEDANIYHDLVKYLLMVRQTVKEPKVDSKLIYAYAKIDRLGETEEFILMPNVANLQNVGDRLFDDALYEAAKIIFTFISNWAKLASRMVKLRQFQGAADAA
ncbi:hypothetical protein OPV22_010305 [Ensete ventricosum]|uniref:Clathrin heavy chain linker core motif domain-containing protein n=1 Tax=Ensete ventricosum TaxID=4639 RepID=A0AAV8RKX3_ENSVE|nr:hypothetical protein OPV22_010305 [Ensete ventricosum]